MAILSLRFIYDFTLPWIYNIVDRKNIIIVYICITSLIHSRISGSFQSSYKFDSRLEPRPTGKINCTGQSNYKMNCPRKVANPVGVLGEHDRADQEPTPWTANFPSMSWHINDPPESPTQPAESPRKPAQKDAGVKRRSYLPQYELTIISVSCSSSGRCGPKPLVRIFPQPANQHI